MSKGKYTADSGHLDGRVLGIRVMCDENCEHTVLPTDPIFSTAKAALDELLSEQEEWVETDRFTRTSPDGSHWQSRSGSGGLGAWVDIEPRGIREVYCAGLRVRDEAVRELATALGTVAWKPCACGWVAMPPGDAARIQEAAKRVKL